MSAAAGARVVHGRARVRNLFLRLVGLAFAAAFLSAWIQLPVLIGARGLLPACPVVERTSVWTAPTVLHLRCDDATLGAVALAGAGAGVALTLGVAPRLCLALAWVLYLSLVAAGRDFFLFQWDNLLLETALFSLFVAPRGWQLRGAPGPPAAGVFLVQWLFVRLHVESGLAKLLLGDPTWRDLTALIAYYETAPLPT